MPIFPAIILEHKHTLKPLIQRRNICCRFLSPFRSLTPYGLLKRHIRRRVRHRTRRERVILRLVVPDAAGSAALLEHVDLREVFLGEQVLCCGHRCGAAANDAYLCDGTVEVLASVGHCFIHLRGNEKQMR